MRKIHILLVENRENEIEFFTQALKESSLSFLCNIARSSEQALKILKNNLPDLIFVDVHIAKRETAALIKQIKTLQKKPVIVYSTVPMQTPQLNTAFLNYVQLPQNSTIMARVLKNLLVTNKIDGPVEEQA